jgi:hypothetical protein
MTVTSRRWSFRPGSLVCGSDESIPTIRIKAGSRAGGTDSGQYRTLDVSLIVALIPVNSPLTASVARSLKRPGAIVLGVFGFGLIVAFAAALTRGPLNRVPDGDGRFYSALAKSMAEGRGFVLDRSPWPTVPHLSRLPLWPVLDTPGRWLFPHADEYIVLRVTAIIVHALGAALLSLLTYRLWRDPLSSWLAGILLAAYIPALALAEDGLSEPAFVMTAIGGCILLFEDDWKQVTGAFLFGLAVLARSNFVILPFTAIPVGLFWRPLAHLSWKRALILSLAFLTPAALWTLRNYWVSGEFPILNGMEGEALYGSNNVVAATNLDSWGDWVFPDMIPGETPKQQLGKQMGEAQLDRYYRREAVAYFRATWRSYPRLILGKVIRGFIPVPWKASKVSYLIQLSRLSLYVILFLAVRDGVVRNDLFTIVLIGMLLATLITTVLFYGSFRFNFCFEPLLLCCIAVWLVARWRNRRRSEPVLSQYEPAADVLQR